jgi:hypothetical protein
LESNPFSRPKPTSEPTNPTTIIHPKLLTLDISAMHSSLLLSLIVDVS